MSQVQYIESQANGMVMSVPKMRSQDGSKEWQNNMTDNLLRTEGGRLFKPVNGPQAAGKTFGMPQNGSIEFEADRIKREAAEPKRRGRPAKAQ